MRVPVNVCARACSCVLFFFLCFFDFLFCFVGCFVGFVVFVFACMPTACLLVRVPAGMSACVCAVLAF